MILNFSSLNPTSSPPHIPSISKLHQYYFQDLSLIIQLNLYIHFYLQIVVTHLDYYSGLPAATPASVQYILPVAATESKKEKKKKGKNPDCIIVLYKVC